MVVATSNAMVVATSDDTRNIPNDFAEIHINRCKNGRSMCLPYSPPCSIGGGEEKAGVVAIMTKGCL